MAIQISQGFNVKSSNPVDTRIVLTKAQMAAMNDNLMPDTYFAICLEDSKIYIYNKNSTANADTGKFTVFESQIVVEGYYLNEKFYTDSTYQVELEKSTNRVYVDKNGNGALYTWDGTKFNRSVQNASDTIAGILKLYNAPGQNTDGTMSQKTITDGVNSIKFVVEDSDSDGEADCLVLDLPWD